MVTVLYAVCIGVLALMVLFVVLMFAICTMNWLNGDGFWIGDEEVDDDPYYHDRID